MMSPKPVWTEGLFVSQHHFQAQDEYHEALVTQRVGALRRHGWGLSELEIDDRLLHAGQFGLRRMVSVWPDGLFVQCGGPSGDPLPEPRPFEAHFRGDETSLDVLAAITLEGGANLPSPGEHATVQRFLRYSRPLDDFNDGGAPQSIEFAIPNLRIVFGNERRERMATMPLAQLVRQSDGKIALRDTFVPPVLSISAAPFLTDGLRRVVGAMIARQRDLFTSRKQRTETSVEFHYTDARRFWLLHTLSASIPVLAHLLDTDRAHPEEVYLGLASLVGALGTFAADGAESSVPKYNHAQLGDVFEQLFARAISLLRVDAAPAYVEIPLERRPDGMFVGRIPEPRLANHEFFVAVRSTMPEPVVRERVPQLLKVAGWRHITEVVRQARHGVRSEVEWTPSSSLPVKPGICFFRLLREGPFWEEIAKSSTLAVYVPNDGEWKDVWFSVYAIDPAYLR
jgi:type VI secretion system protein ImpJ